MASPLSGQLTDVGSDPEKVSALFTVTQPGCGEARCSCQHFRVGWVPQRPPGSTSTAERCHLGCKVCLSCLFKPSGHATSMGPPRIPVSQYPCLNSQSSDLFHLFDCLGYISSNSSTHPIKAGSWAPEGPAGLHAEVCEMCTLWRLIALHVHWLILSFVNTQEASPYLPLMGREPRIS